MLTYIAPSFLLLRAQLVVSASSASALSSEAKRLMHRELRFEASMEYLPPPCHWDQAILQRLRAMTVEEARSVQSA